MPYLITHLLLAVMCLCVAPVWAATPVPADTVVLNDSTSSFEITTDVQSWIDTGSKASIALVTVLPENFGTGAALLRHSLTERDTLWIKLRMLRPVGASAAWTLNIPLPFVDSVTLYQRNETGNWAAQAAGDTLPQSSWSKKGLYPEFDLTLPSGTPQEVYLRVRNFKHVSIPIRLATVPEREFQRLREALLLGLMLGTLLALSTLSLVRYLEHGNRSDVFAALFSLLIIVTVAQVNGILNVFVWSGMPEWGNYAYAMAPVLAMGGALLFVRNLYMLSTQYHRYDAVLNITGWGTLASILVYAILARSLADRVSYLVLLSATLVGLAAAVLSWRGGSPIWRWLMLAYVPQFLGLLRMVAEAMGLVPTLWEMRYITSVSAAMSVPLLVYALSRTTHDRKELEVRANHLPTQDALTGLLTREVFQTHLNDAVERAIDNREPIALVLVRVINHEHIRQSLGDPVAEQSLLRAVVKLHRILRDVDPAGRVASAQFALLLDGVASRQILTERMVQLIASGLIPLPGLNPPVTLQFHVACVLLHENPLAPEGALAQLDELLEGMSPHTRRPIRFLEPVPTQAAVLQTGAAPA